MSERAAVVSLVKTIVGGGILALPSGMAAGRGTGVAPALAIVALHATLSAYTYTLVGRAVEISDARDFSELWAEAFSRRSSWLIDVMVGGVASGVILTYGCFLGDLLSSLVPSISRMGAIIGLAVFPLAPLALARDLSALRHSSLVGVAAVLTSAFVIIKRSLDGTYGDNWLGASVRSSTYRGVSASALAQLSMSRVSVGTCVLFNMLSTAFMAHTNAVRAYRELSDRSRQYAVALKAWLISGLIYAGVMLAGYLTFGSDSKGLILANYDTTDPLAFATRVATGISLVSSHPLVFTSLRDCSSSLLKLPSSAFVPLSLGLLALFTALAIAVPDAGFVVSFTGASVGSALICVVPCLVYLRIAKPKADDPERLLLKCLVVFGVAIATFGSIVTCLETFTDLLK